MTKSIDSFDYVIVGAGAGGCVLANRLVADGSSTVCLLEAGPPDNSVILHIPAGVYKASTNPKYAWQFETEPNPATANRAIPMPQGKTLGGSTAINGMNYNRGCPDDFDGWARRGNGGWGYADVLPYFKKSERRLGTCDRKYRGTDGPLPITDCNWRHPLCDAFIEAAHGLGLPRNPDYNGASQLGVGYYQSYIHKGRRVSAARAFVQPVAKNKNLEIRTRAQATAVLFEQKRAVGVRYTQGPGHPYREVRARREVILAAGAANTPKLLQLSGIGPSTLLGELGIPVINELAGVGANLQDHYMVHLVLRVKEIETINGRGLALVREAAKWVLNRPSILAISPSLVYGFVNSRDLCSTPDIQLDFALGNYSNLSLERFPVIKLGFYQLQPQSRGFVRASSADSFRAPVIQPNYLVDERDQRVVIDSIRTLRRVFAAPELARYYDSEELPGSSVVEDSECLEFARQAGLTAYHLSGTCQMGPRHDRESVVDDQLRVHGLEALRIADASIMPTVPSANTSAAVFMIAEKAADMILRRAPVPEIDFESISPARPSDKSAGAAKTRIAIEA
jgi:choline dehydrogenase